MKTNRGKRGPLVLPLILVLPVLLVLLGMVALALACARVRAKEDFAAVGAVNASSINVGILAVEQGGTGNQTGLAKTVDASGIKSGVLAVRYGGTGGTTGVPNNASYCRVIATSTAAGGTAGTLDKGGNPGGDFPDGMNAFKNCAVDVQTSPSIRETSLGWNASKRVFDIPFGGVWQFSWQGRYSGDDNTPIIAAKFRVVGDVDGDNAVYTTNWSGKTPYKQRDGKITYTAIIKDPLPSDGASVAVFVNTVNTAASPRWYLSILKDHTFTAVYLGKA